MNLLVPAALAFSLIIPVILLLYFMRPKRQERVIGSTLLWQQVLQDLQASRPWQRLRFTPLLLLQLLAAAIIVLVLTRPAIFASSPLGGDTAIILQASASMQATDVAPNRFENAKSRIADFIDTLGPGDHLSLITMARSPQVLIASSQDKDQLLAALQRTRVTNQDADLEQALSLATALLAGHAHSQVLVVGDGHVLPPDQTLALPFPVRYLRIGTDAANTALLALAARTLHGNLFALAQVANYSHQQRSIPVELYADGRLVNVQTLTLAPEANGALQWGPLPAMTRFLYAHVISQDAMTIDHEGWAVVGGALHGRVLLVTKGNSFLEAALRLQPNIDLYETTPDKYVDSGAYDLTVFDGFVPARLPTGGLFFVNPPPGSYLFGSSGPAIRVSHIGAGNDTASLLANVDLSSIHVLRASRQLTAASWTQSIITAPETPLLLAGEKDNRRVAVLGFDLHDSDLALQPSFPILMFNMVNWFLPSPVANDAQVTPGAPVTLQTWPGAERVTVTDPNQQALTIAPPFPVVPYNDTNRLGIYYIVQRVRGQDRQGAFTVNLFDAMQSQLAPVATLPVVHSSDFTTDANQVPRQLREIWPWIAAFLLLVLCIEWWLFSRSYSSAAAQTPLGRGARSQQTLGNKSYFGGPLSRLQGQVEREYSARVKSITKAIKRAKGRFSRRRAKGGKRARI